MCQWQKFVLKTGATFCNCYKNVNMCKKNFVSWVLKLGVSYDFRLFNEKNKLFQGKGVGCIANIMVFKVNKHKLYNTLFPWYSSSWILYWNNGGIMGQFHQIHILILIWCHMSIFAIQGGNFFWMDRFKT